MLKIERDGIDDNDDDEKQQDTEEVNSVQKEQQTKCHDSHPKAKEDGNDES